MSDLLKRIATDQLTARKAGDKTAAAVLTTLLGEAGKLTAEDHKKGVTEVTDGRVIAVLKVFVDNIRQSLEVVPEDRKETLQRELAVLSEYVPAQMDEEELRRVIAAYKLSGANLGQIMGFLKTKFEGRYDGKLASTIAKE